MKKKEKERAAKQKNTRRSDFLKAVSGSLLLVALGVLLIFCPDLGAAAVAVTVGWVLIAVGGVGILVCLLSWPVLGLGTLLLSIAAVGLGIYLLLKPLALASLFGMAAGLYLLLNGLSSLLESLKLKKMGLGFLPSLIVALLLTALGLTLIFAPLTSSRLLMTLLGVGMVVCGGVNTLLRAWVAGKLSQPKKDPQIVDADE